MTDQQKTRCAALLFEAMDGIRDDYLDEAIRWRQRPVSVKKRPAKRRAAWTWAAAAALVLVVTLAVVPTVLQTGSGENAAPGKHHSVLSDCIRDAVDSHALAACAENDLPFADGCSYVVVRDTATGCLYRSGALSDEERRYVASDLAASSYRMQEEAAAPDDYLIWVIDGNGTVTSPCLLPSPGNVGVNALFDYEPERLPTESIRRLILHLSAS